MVASRTLAFYRRLWRSSFREFTPPEVAPQPGVQPIAPVTEAERLSRFVLDRKHFDADRVKFRAFEPPPGEVTLSVSRTDGLTEPEVWRHGDKWVAEPNGRTIYARGDFNLKQVREVQQGGFGLSVAPDEEPERHANVVGWPTIEQKEVRRSLAQQLAAQAFCVPRPPVGPGRKAAMPVTP